MSDYGGSNTPVEQRDCWRTPPEIFAALNAEFNFQLDAAASEHNTLCPFFITEQQNALTTDWSAAMAYGGGYVWLNPPYSDIGPFVRKAADEKTFAGLGCVMLVPSDPSVGWFKEAEETASEIRLITGGRLAFVNPITGKPVGGNSKGSCLLIWHPWPRTHCHISTVSRNALMTYGAKLVASADAA